MGVFGRKKVEEIAKPKPIIRIKEEEPEVQETEVEEEKPEVKEEKKTRIQVVKEIPQVPVRKYTDKVTGEEVLIITIEEALTDIMNRED